MSVVIEAAHDLSRIPPFALRDRIWPDKDFYDKQQEIIWSVEHNDRTWVPAGNMLGKDFVAGFIVPNNFLRARLLGKTARIITTSVKDDHLRVLWGEIGRFVQDATEPLDYRKGGPLVLNHRDIRWDYKKKCDISYIRGMVSEKGEGMAGHHADYTLGVIDEASGVDDLVYTQMETWAKVILIFGNPNPTTNFFYRGVEAGDVPKPYIVK